MGISAVPSTSVAGMVPRVLARIKEIPGLTVGEDTRIEGAPSGDKRRDEAVRGDSLPGERAASAVSSALDPRKPASILAGDDERKVAAKKTGEAVAAREESRRRDTKRLDELLGQKAGLEVKQAQSKSERSAEVVAQLAQLKARDSEVRAHEAAHMAAGGRYVTGGASYVYQKGPDGGQYAVGGEVGIDTSPVPGKPEETAQKMRTVRAAALAPSEPSSADLSVAASASEAEAAAVAEIAQARADELAGRYKKEKASGGAPPGNPLDMVA
jgi:hypothetical protein